MPDRIGPTPELTANESLAVTNDRLRRGLLASN